MGTRLGYGVPKCLLDLDGKPLIEMQLALLQSVPDVRVVVGYQETDVMDAALRVRRDIVFVRNPRYRETTTQDSYALGCKHLNGGCLFLDADIWFAPETFGEFLHAAPRHPLAIGVTAAKTDDAVYAHVLDGQVVTFSRDERSPLEWANLVWAPAGTFAEGGGAVFETLRSHLPAPAIEVQSFEVDTEMDLQRARQAVRDRQRQAHHTGVLRPGIARESGPAGG